MSPLSSDDRQGSGSRRMLVFETSILLGLSLGRSAIYSILSIIESLTRPTPLNQQTTTMNPSVVPDRPWLDLAYQVVGMLLPLVVVALAFYLVRHVAAPELGPWRAMHLDGSRPVRDLVLGVLLAAAVGIPGLGFYLLAREIGINLNVAAANLTENWWTVPVYIGMAAMNGILEEVIMVGYLFLRWRQAGWQPARIIVVSALIRGLNHLYQGFGGMIGNIVMGLFFGWMYQRTRRLWPLVIAHTLIDIVAFIGYALLKDVLTWL